MNGVVAKHPEEEQTMTDDVARGGEESREAKTSAEPVFGIAPGKTAEVVAVRSSPPVAPKRAESPWRRRLVLVAGPLALAAAMIIYVTGQSGPAMPELPAYTVTTSGPQMQGSTEGAPRLRLSRSAPRDARVELLLQPSTAPQDKVVAYAFTFASSESEPVPLEAKVEISPDGAVKLTGAPRALEGASEIRVVIGAPAAIGKFDDAAGRARAARSDAHVQVLTVPIERE